MPVEPPPIVDRNEYALRTIQREKRAEWIEFAAALDQHTMGAIEAHISRSVSAAIAAFNYLEDRPLRDEAHKAIHRAAFVKRGLFGCPIVLRDGEYWTDCPIKISHLRIGVSAGLVSDFECCICNSLAEDCDHQMGQAYPKRAERDAEGRCTLCAAVDCGHAEGELFPVEAYATARNANATEVTLVSRPRYPLARITEVTVDLGSTGNDPRVRQAAEHGNLNCDADLGPCNGFNEMRDRNAGDSVAAVQ